MNNRKLLSFVLILLALLALAQSAFAAKNLDILTASIYQSSSATIGSGTAICTGVNIDAAGAECSTALNTGIAYRFEFVGTNTGTTDADIERTDFRNVFKASQAVGANATLTECGCYEDSGTKHTGSFSIGGTGADDIWCTFTDPNWCRLSAGGDTDDFYFIITIGSDAATDTDTKFFVKSGAASALSVEMDIYIATPVCGNDTKEVGETCDGTDLDSETCVSQGYASGDLACESDCSAFDISSCVSAAVCGNNLKETGETCDGTDLAGENCESMGYDSGTLFCTTDCSSFDSSSCSGTGPICGNGNKEGSEVCDGSDLGGVTCISQGFTGGTLGCQINCAAFDTSNCTGEPIEGVCGANCCGNRICEDAVGEDFGSCRIDCSTPSKIFFTFYNPEEGKTFSRGEKILVKVGIKADSIIPGIGDVEWVRVECPDVFGVLGLVDDGLHEDGEAGDSVYANSFLIEKDVNAGEKTITVSAQVVATVKQAFKSFSVDPSLKIDFFTDKNSYTQGDLIEINGFIKRGGQDINALIDLNISFDGNLFFDWNTSSDSNGFSKAFQTTTILPAGEWSLSLTAVDDFNNQGNFSKKIKLFQPKPFSALTISLADPLREWTQRGDQIKFTVNVLDEYNELAKKALVELFSPSGETIVLEESSNKVYTGVFTVPWNAPQGDQNFVVKALRKTDYSVQRGENNFVLLIKPSQLNFELLEPKKIEFSAGEEINFRLRVSYPSGEPVAEPAISALVNGKPVSLVAEEKGIYAGTYLISLADSGRLVFSAKAEDQFANSGSKEYELYVSGISWLYWVREFTVSIVLLVFGFLLAVLLVFLFMHRKASLTSLLKKKRELEALREDIQKRYYKLNVINRETYNKLRSKCEPELEAVNQAIKALKKQKEGKKVG